MTKTVVEDLGTCGAGQLQKVGGMNVLKVGGDFREMGYQHGALMKSLVPEGPIPYFRTYVEKFMGSALGPASPLLWPALQQFVGRRVEKQLPDFALETMRGLAEGAEIPLRHFLDGATMPDSLLVLTSKFMKWGGSGPAVRHRLALGLGCTSAVAWGGATGDGRLLHARNFDYYAVSAWPRTRSVIFHEPEMGHRYVSAAAAGVPLGGITAMNDAGLSLTVHQHMFTDRAALGGTPIGLVGDIVMREASNLDDAERILSDHNPIGCWTYVVTDGNAKEVLCFEENPERQVAIRTSADDTTFAYSNIYLDPELGATEVNLYGSYWRNNQARYARAVELLDEGHGQHDAESMAQLLGDTGTGECRLSESIRMLMTVGSVVFRPEDGVLWVASGEAPSCHREFVPFDLSRGGYAPEHGTLSGDPGLESDEKDAFEAYRRSYLAYLDSNDLEESVSMADRARTLDDKEPLYHNLFGLLALKHGRADAARGAFDRALELGHVHEERLAAFSLWRARADDVLGEREDAVPAYRRALGYTADHAVKRAAERGLRRRYRARDARKINVDFAFSDVVRP